MSYEVGTSFKFSDFVEEEIPQRLWDIGTKIIFVKFAESISRPLPVLY